MKENNENFGMEDGFDSELISELLEENGLGNLFDDIPPKKSSSKSKQSKTKSSSKNNSVSKEENIDTVKKDTINTPTVEKGEGSRDKKLDKVPEATIKEEPVEVAEVTGETAHEVEIQKDSSNDEKVEDVNLFSAFTVKQEVSNVNDEQIFEVEEDNEIDFNNLIEETEIDTEEDEVAIQESNISNDLEDIDDDVLDNNKLENDEVEINNKWSHYNKSSKKANDKKPGVVKAILKALLAVFLLLALIIGGMYFVSSQSSGVSQEEVVNDYQLLSSSIDDTLFDLSLYLNNRISDDMLLTQLEAKVFPHSLSSDVNDTIDEYKVIHQNLQNSLKSASSTSQVDSAIDTYVKNVTNLEAEINELFKNKFNSQGVEYIETTNGDLDVL